MCYFSYDNKRIKKQMSELLINHFVNVITVYIYAHVCHFKICNLIFTMHVMVLEKDHKLFIVGLFIGLLFRELLPSIMPDKQELTRLYFDNIYSLSGTHLTHTA